MFQYQTLANNKNNSLDTSNEIYSVTFLRNVSISKSNSPLKMFLDILLELFGPQILHSHKCFNIKVLLIQKTLS